MELLLSLVVGVLFATGTYLILRRNLLKIVIGLSLVANAVNLLIFTTTGLVRDRPPIIAEGAVRLDAPYADPLSQAMILTAIVITFGFLAFFIVLVLRVSDVIGSDDPDEAKTTEGTERRDDTEVDT